MSDEQHDREQLEYWKRRVEEAERLLGQARTAKLRLVHRREQSEAEAVNYTKRAISAIVATQQDEQLVEDIALVSEHGMQHATEQIGNARSERALERSLVLADLLLSLRSLAQTSPAVAQLNPLAPDPDAPPERD